MGRQRKPLGNSRPSRLAQLNDLYEEWIGNWTLEMLAVAGQGRDDQLPALDVAYLKLVGLAARLGRRATEDEVRAFFAPYGEYAALAGCYALQRRFA